MSSRGSGGVEKHRGRKVTLLLDSGEWKTHNSGVNRILAKPGDDSVLYTASRDSTAKRWSVESTSGRTSTWQVACDASFEGHSDWINDIALMENNVLVTASSDKVIRCWDGESGPQGKCIQLLYMHSDYVQCLQAAANKPFLASAGLTSECYLWDLSALRPVLNLAARERERSLGDAPPPPSPVGRLALEQATSCRIEPVWRPAAPFQGQSDPAALLRGSIYAMALDKRALSVVATGSTDGFIRVYDPRVSSADGQLVCKLRGHTDNVRAMVLDESASLLLSASSDRTVRLWDLGQQRCVQTFKAGPDAACSLAVDDRTRTIYCGGRDKTVRRINMATRSWDVLCEVENAVRSLALSPDGSLLWVGTTHSNLAAYDLAAADGAARERAALVGGHGAYAHHPHKASAEGRGSDHPAAGAPRGVGVSPSKGVQSTLAARALQWGMAQPAPSTVGIGMTQAEATMGTSLGTTPAALALASQHTARSPGSAAAAAAAAAAAGPRPLLDAPKILIRGRPPIVQAHVLEDRQHVLCRDMDGRVTLWDVVSASVVRDFGRADFRRTAEALFKPAAVTPWFQTDTRLGSLALRLDPCVCFSAEVYAHDVGCTQFAEDKKFNYGDQTVTNAFRLWRAVYLRRLKEGDPAVPAPPHGLEPPTDGTVWSDLEDDEADAMATADRRFAPDRRRMSSAGTGGGGGGGGGAASPSQRSTGTGTLAASPSGRSLYIPRDMPPFRYSRLPSPPIILCETDGLRPWRCPMDAFDGTEPLGDVIPLWVYNVVIRGEYPTALMQRFPKEHASKLTFELAPGEGSGLPELPQTSLTAPKILKIGKVVSYTASKLAELGHLFAVGPSPDVAEASQASTPVGTPTKKVPEGVPVPPTPSMTGLPPLEVTCNGYAVPYTMTLAAVKKYMCKGGELVLHYKGRSPVAPTPLLPLKPPPMR